jgi:hypothetical protein
MHDPMESVKYSDRAGLTLSAINAVNGFRGTHFACAKFAREIQARRGVCRLRKIEARAEAHMMELSDTKVSC